MTLARQRRTKLFVMGAVDVVYLVAASLWIGVVLGASWIALRFAMTVRSRRRRINRLLVLIGLGRRGSVGRRGRRQRGRPGFASQAARILTDLTGAEPRKARRRA
ncbi:MAG: hypothetical protein ABW137_34825 [Mycobacterium sp.]